jgi:tetratricopeptide (TPR) repeat protein
MAKAWAKFPYPDKTFQYTATTLKKAWDRLHRGDGEPWPAEAAAVQAWIAFHAGEFQQAAEAAAAAKGAARVAGLKAQAIHANYLEADEARKLALFQDVAQRAEKLQVAEPDNAAGWYWHAYALGRYAQGISIAKALAQGIGGKVKASLEQTIALAPRHADAHIALGAYHAEIIDKVGAMIGGLTYGARKDTGLEHYSKALELNPDSAIARIEYANGLVMLDGKKALARAEKLYAEAAACTPLDAMERLDVELARAELQD